MENRVIATTECTPLEVALKMDQDGFVRCKSLYEFLELDKTHYIRWCKANIDDNPYAERNVDYQVLAFKGENPQGGRPTTDYKLTASFAKKLAMQSKTERGEQARCYFIACEESLKKIALERKQWEIERAKGVMIRHILTDTIKMKIADSPHKRFAYPNYTKLIYKMIFGTDLKTLQEKYGVKAKESIREYLTVEQLREVESIEMLVSSLINIGMGYDEIKSFLELRYKSDLLLTA
jgi:phage anti-repressor protein